MYQVFHKRGMRFQFWKLKSTQSIIEVFDLISARLMISE